MFKKSTFAFAALLSILCFTAEAAVITDPAGDFLASYTGPQNGDLDVVSAEVIYNGPTFQFNSQSNGAIGTTPGGFFVWGINRGTGTSRFSVIAPGVLFDFVVILTPNGQSSVRDLIAGVTTNLDASAVTFSGNSLSATVNSSLIPSRGFTFENYTVNLWPRVAGGTEAISDFAPDNSNAAITTPEPTTMGLMAASLIALAFTRKRR